MNVKTYETIPKWITILYNQPIFRVKNNGWISQPYTMYRGQRQGCPLSALIFILIVEVLAISVRNNNDIKGMTIGDIEHKIVQYADDATLILGDFRSIEKAIDIINTFSAFAGPKLNKDKTKGIWLGPLKDLGLLVLFHIVWVMIMKYSEWLRSRSDYSRHSLIALLGGCGTRFVQTSSPSDSVGFPLRTNREG